MAMRVGKLTLAHSRDNTQLCVRLGDVFKNYKRRTTVTIHQHANAREGTCRWKVTHQWEIQKQSPAAQHHQEILHKVSIIVKRDKRN
uniref:Uncharacterized protein n=1 Tax=Knipowitschia caucasica TaxID=637954 RepID=A0AAV2LIJ5_KNICA